MKVMLLDKHILLLFPSLSHKDKQEEHCLKEEMKRGRTKDEEEEKQEHDDFVVFKERWSLSCLCSTHKMSDFHTTQT